MWSSGMPRNSKLFERVYAVLCCQTLKLVYPLFSFCFFMILGLAYVIMYLYCNRMVRVVISEYHCAIATCNSRGSGPGSLRVMHCT